MQVFMITSCFSKYKDVVALILVNNMTNDYLKDLIISVITMLERIEVLTLISDNNVNRWAFELMTSSHTLQPYIPHPLDPSRTLFLFLTQSIFLNASETIGLIKRMKTAL